MNIGDQISIWKVQRKILGTISLVKQFRSQSTLTVYFSGFSSRNESEVAVFVVSVSSSSWINMGLKYSLSHELFIEKKPYIQLKTKFSNRAIYISSWLKATYAKSNLLQQTKRDAQYVPIVIYLSKLSIVIQLTDSNQ